MQIIEPFVEIESDELSRSKLANIEKAARTCYKSEFTGDPAFVERVVKRGHESVLEHEKITCRIICDRGVSHEIVRHRVAAYSQESTRYCNYSKDKYNGEVTFIKPFGLDIDAYRLWLDAMECGEDAYLSMLEKGVTPEWARSVLPNSLKTEIVVTYNFREWRHFLKVRCDKAAHPQIRQIALGILFAFREVYPELFADVPYDTSFNIEDVAKVVVTHD